ncbi:DEAD/DEAH box helicase [Persicobacter sp. CCB-QB2]|uniref:DEAD/DEAH box helicase n=1 Tax=Persicobacter sp. CCB-QB2 TaxID=1561025 RepID=UPI0006A9EE77|nr:DEAD/DEAH box helicase [Persicobacter sp. CCB-QB2]
MKVATDQPFRLIYSLFEHECLGYLFESFVIQEDAKGKLTLSYQNISAQNAPEFQQGLDERDYELLEIIDAMQQDAIMRKFSRKHISLSDFFEKYYKVNKAGIKDEVDAYLEMQRAKLLPLLVGKPIFEMGKDGYPAESELQWAGEKASLWFHFKKREDHTRYFPTVYCEGENIQFKQNGSYLLCKEPAWLVANGKVYHFKIPVDGKKLIPFLRKFFIMIPDKIRANYFQKFVTPLVASFDVKSDSFEVFTEEKPVIPVLSYHEILPETDTNQEAMLALSLNFQYGDSAYPARNFQPYGVRLEENAMGFAFHRTKRNFKAEKAFKERLARFQGDSQSEEWVLPLKEGMNWLNEHYEDLQKEGFNFQQRDAEVGRKFFVGEAKFILEIRENIDWFDVHATIQFGEYRISIKSLKNAMRKDGMLTLPNGELALVPAEWYSKYADLVGFLEDHPEDDSEVILKKHHLMLVEELQQDTLAKVTIDRKLEQLRDFEQIEDYAIPEGFSGELRPYQKAGYNWMRFLAQYKFGGCLADDMGLGKTVQTLALLQASKEESSQGTSLLVMPTSLIYNWEIEAKKFTPELKVLIYTGTNRDKDVSKFSNYDLVLTSYGIIRLDVDILSQFYFNYVILDESQAIKNPASNITQAVQKLNSKNRLILTGTPLENSTMDLWSQITFINPGLLGGQSFFRNEYLNPIEKKKDEEKTQKLYSLIKPFILRRHKSQVAKELPEKVVNVKYSSMAPEQQKRYDQVKSYYRDLILGQIEEEGLKKSHFTLLQGLSKLRQIANHPALVETAYKGESGKMNDMMTTLESGISEGHKILIFSQYVKHLSLVRQQLEERNIVYSYLDGTTKDRKQAVDNFQNNDEVQVFLISLKAGGVGLNLTKADYVFILDPWWNPAVELQAVDRAHRIGQKKKVFTYKFIGKGTVEEKILALQQNKQQLADALITTEESFVKELSQHDIESLLS